MTTTHWLEDLPDPIGSWRTISPENLPIIGSRKYRAMSMTQPLVAFGAHPVIEGYVRAFREHRPITISPDIIWLLIVQGFAQHVVRNAEALRSYFVNFEGKKELVVDRRDLNWYSATSEELSSVFPMFVDQIAEHVGESLVNTLTSNFTTTTAITLAVSQVSIMAGMKEYFEYIAIMGGSGYPSITIEGNLEDWRRIAVKAEELSQYDLEWWISEMRPILHEFIEAKSGNFNREFWMGMIRHREPSSLWQEYIEGWFLKFFPYLDDGKRSNFTRIENSKSLPHESLTVPILVKIVRGPDDPEAAEVLDTELKAGFVGVSQDPTTGNIKPEIGWVWFPERSEAPNNAGPSYRYRRVLR